MGPQSSVRKGPFSNNDLWVRLGAHAAGFLACANNSLIHIVWTAVGSPVDYEFDYPDRSGHKQGLVYSRLINSNQQRKFCDEAGYK